MENLSYALKTVGHQFVSDAPTAVKLLSEALGHIARSSNLANDDNREADSFDGASNDPDGLYFTTYGNNLEAKEVPQLVSLWRTIETKRDEVDALATDFKEKYSLNPASFWTSFSGHPLTGDAIRQLVVAIDHYSLSGPLARRLLCRRLSQEISNKAEKLKETNTTLRVGQSYRDLAFSMSVNGDMGRHKKKLQEGDRWSLLDAGVLVGIMTPNWER